MALRSSGSGAAVSGSLAWLRRVQGDDGGWGAVPGAGSDPDSTGAVLQALDRRLAGDEARGPLPAPLPGRRVEAGR